MRYVEAAGLKVSAIGLGTWQFGSWEWGYGHRYARQEAGAIVRRALEMGVTLFDTAELYGFGRSERILGRALAGHTGDVVVATKLLPVTPAAGLVQRRAQASARRLGVQTIDLYQIHQPNPLAQSPTTMRGLRRLLDTGLVRKIGVSNYSLGRWKAAEARLGRPVVANQVSFSLARRDPALDLVPYAADRDRLIIAYSPLGQGLLAGGYGPDNRPWDPVRRSSRLFLPTNLERAGELVATLREVAAAHDVTPAQVALAWVIRRPNVVAIPGASSVAQMEANAAAADLDLSDEQDRQLAAAAAAFTPASHLTALTEQLASRLSG